jgi:hypothetical protein
LISEGLNNTHGHPSYFVIDECYKYFKSNLQVDNNFIYYNQNNKSKDAVYRFCKFPYLLKSSVILNPAVLSHTAYLIETRHYLITYINMLHSFVGNKGAEYMMTYRKDAIDTFTPSVTLSDNKNEPDGVFESHLIYEFDRGGCYG